MFPRVINLISISILLSLPGLALAQKTSCSQSYDAATNLVTVDVLQAGSAKLTTQFSVQTNSTGGLVFVLASAITTTVDCSDPVTIVGDTLVIPDLVVGAGRYYAEIKLVAGSSPYQFTATTARKNPRLVPDAGIRVSTGGIPFATVNATTGVTNLGYSEVGTGLAKFQTATDGLTFGNPTLLTYNNRSVDSRRTLMPDGKTWRLYEWDMSLKAFTSYVSTDGNVFTRETGTRYSAAAADNATVGVYEAYVAKDNSVILVYLGDLQSKNNLRMARSIDNGVTFTYLKGNVLGDDSAGGGANSFVDTKTLLLKDGRRRLISMRQLGLHTFISDDGITYVREPGTRITAADFAAAGATVYTVNDPVMVYDKSGNLKVYVAGATTKTTPGGPESSTWGIVSATWQD
ncbi:MAG: hypothetical protein D4S02_07000 [Rhodocyclaceae bacterium]|nr:MAG: hypothetical protein D4S02_07000 [Rhodocyclaceae bacterium]